MAACPESAGRFDFTSLPAGVKRLIGPEGLIALAELPEVDTVVAAVVGSAGLASSLAAARQGKRLALANKEALVALVVCLPML
ncbi:MAG: hypothetical protein R3C56_43065 [Pirellulaceae bacterium]